MGKIGDFRRKSPFISETARDRPNAMDVNRKSCVPDRMVSFSIALSDPNPVFKVTAFLKSNISKTVRFRDKVTKEH